MRPGQENCHGTASIAAFLSSTTRFCVVFGQSQIFRRIGAGLFGGRQDTLMFNGYEAEVAGLYVGQDLTVDF